MNYNLNQAVFVKAFNDGVVVYNDNTGSTHKLDTLSGYLLSFFIDRKNVSLAQLHALHNDLQNNHDISFEDYLVYVEEFIDILSAQDIIHHH